MKRHFFPFFIVLLLSACATTPTPPARTTTQAQSPQQHIEKIAAIRAFSLKARIGVQADGKGFSGPMTWQHQAERDIITFYSPLGSPVALIEKADGKVTLTDAKGNQLTEDNLQTLTEKTLGWSLPLEGLTDWALGRPSAQRIQLQSRDADGRLIKLKQEDWDIDYQSYMRHEDAILPQRLNLRRVEANVKLVVESWSDISQ